jgi:hypothetical protein
MYVSSGFSLPMNARTTVRLPEELLRRAKRKAAEEGRTLTSLVEDGLRHVIDGDQGRKRRPIELPVSKASGGFKPGMENLSFAQMQELEDLEYIERLQNGFT